MRHLAIYDYLKLCYIISCCPGHWLIQYPITSYNIMQLRVQTYDTRWYNVRNIISYDILSLYSSIMSYNKISFHIIYTRWYRMIWLWCIRWELILSYHIASFNTWCSRGHKGHPVRLMSIYQLGAFGINDSTYGGAI